MAHLASNEFTFVRGQLFHPAYQTHLFHSTSKAAVLMNCFPSKLATMSMVAYALWLAPLGCSQQSALESRMKEFAYSVEGLADELAPRLEQARLSPKAERRNAQADAVSQIEAGRGGDGDRPDPGTVGAIALDAAAKIQKMKSQGIEGDLQQMLLEKLDANGKIKADIMSEFKSNLASNLSSSQ